MESCGKLLITSEQGSQEFQQKTIAITEQEPFVIGRSVKDIPVSNSNGRFQSRVLSKDHARITYTNNRFILQDLGSSNGTFIGDHKLRSDGEVSGTRIYSGDIIRFGSETLDKQRQQSEKCVIAAFKLFHPTGEEEIARPDSERLIPNLEETIGSGKPRRKKPRVKLDDEDIKVYEDIGEPLRSLSPVQKEELAAAAKQQLRALSAKEKEQLAAAAKQQLAALAIVNQQQQQQKEQLQKDQQQTAERQLSARKEQAQNLIRLQEQVDQLEKKLKRKTNEVKNLSDNLDNIRKESDEHEETILSLRIEMEELKLNLDKMNQENVNLSDKLAVKTKEEIENVKVSELESELQEHKRILGKLQEEKWILREKLRMENEQKSNLEERLIELNNRPPTTNDQKFQEIIFEKDKVIRSKNEEIEQVTDLLRKSDEMLKERERENAWLNDMLNQHVEKIQEKESEFLSLQHCMTEENETVHQIEKEMVRLIKIIEEDQQNAAIKDHMMSGYSEEIKYLKEKLDAEKQNLEKQKETADQNMQIALNHKNSEIENLQKEIEEARTRDQSKETEAKESGENLQKALAKIAAMESDMARMRDAYKMKEFEMEALKGANQRFKVMEENGVDYKSLQQKLIKEQAANKELEDEIIQLKMEKSNLQDQEGFGMSGDGSKMSPSVTPTPGIQLPPGPESLIIEEKLKRQAEEIKRLQTELMNEKQISNHIQITQEQELVQKEREIERLSGLLNPMLPSVNRMMRSGGTTPVQSPRPRFRRGVSDATMTDTEEDTLSYHDAMSEDERPGSVASSVAAYGPAADFIANQKRMIEADEISLG